MSRVIVTAAAAAALVAVAAVPAGADVPSKGDTFVVSTFFEGKILCATTHQEPGFVPVFPLVACNIGNPAQQWKIAANGRFFENVASGMCLSHHSYFRPKERCEHATSGPLVWHQDVLGRVWMPGDNSITKTFWAPIRHIEYGPMISFSTRSNGTTPGDATPFYLGVVNKA
jgi:hypothetical protein